MILKVPELLTGLGRNLNFSRFIDFIQLFAIFNVCPLLLASQKTLISDIKKIVFLIIDVKLDLCWFTIDYVNKIVVEESKPWLWFLNGSDAARAVALRLTNERPSFLRAKPIRDRVSDWKLFNMEATVDKLEAMVRA